MERNTINNCLVAPGRPDVQIADPIMTLTGPTGYTSESQLEESFATYFQIACITLAPKSVVQIKLAVAPQGEKEHIVPNWAIAHLEYAAFGRQRVVVESKCFASKCQDDLNSALGDLGRVILLPKANEAPR